MSTDRVLITGVGGLIGAAVCQRLASEGKMVVGMDRVVPRDFAHPFIAHDLPDTHRWYEAIQKYQINKIVHAGGISGPMLLNDAPNRIVGINLVGLTDLLEVARIVGLERIVGFSSVVAYGEHDDLTNVSERSWLNPSNVYGATKAAGDALINAYHAAYGVDMVSFRVAGCYGPGRTTPCLIRQLIENALDDQQSAVCEDPRRTRQYIYVDDVVDAVVKALVQPTFSQRTYNIAPGEVHSAQDIIDAVKTCLPQLKARIDPDGMRWNSFGVGCLDITAARRDFGFDPVTDLATGAKATLDWVIQTRKRASHA